MMNNPLDITRFRYERKFLLTQFSRYEIESIIRNHPAIFIEAFPERYVNNIYLDTWGMSNYLDSIEGSYERLKVRIRWYGELFGLLKNPILEFKIKMGFLRNKKSYPLHQFYFDESCSLEKLQNIFSISNISESLIEYLGTLRLSLLNRYHRKYYESIDHKFRITIDYDMNYYKLDQAKNSFNEMIADDSSIVLELKYSRKDDLLADSITNFFPFRMTRNSKYINGISILQKTKPIE